MGWWRNPTGMDPRLPPETIGDAYTSEFAWSVLEDLVKIGNRMGGQAGEKEGAQIIKDAFETIGARETDITEFDMPGWWRGSSSITLPDHDEHYEAEHQVLALPGTPATTQDAEIIDMGYGIPSDFDSSVEDAVVMVRSDTPSDYDHWYHRMEKYAAAVDHGAAGFIYRNHVPGCLPATGEIGYHNRPGPIPGVAVSKELGSRIERYCEANGTISGSLTIDCENAPTTVPNTSAALGPETETEVLVTAHVDAHDISEGARDNGVGSALVCEIGRLLTTVEDSLETKVRLITFGSEELGLYGAYDWAATHESDAIKCVMNIDRAGDTRNPKVRRTNSFQGMEPPFERAADRLNVPLEIERSTSPHGDSWPFAEKGIPAVTVGSALDSKSRGWGHTHGDTLDKLDHRDIQALAVVFTEAVLDLTQEDTVIPRKSPDDILDELDDPGIRELEFGGRYHF